jgi:hypothetical protein
MEQIKIKVRSSSFIILLPLIFIGCSFEERPSYQAYQNNIPAGGIGINYDPNSSLTNITEIQSQLSEADEKVFTASLSWFGSESDVGFDRIHGKTAKQLVDIVNCLKTTEPDQQSACLE